MFSRRVDSLKIAGICIGSAIGGSFLYSYMDDSRAAVYPAVIMPLMHKLDPERSHKLSIWFAKFGLSPRERHPIIEDRLQVKVWGKTIDSPIGLAAGYDKHGEAIDSLFKFGFGTVEIGSVTPQPQSGNPKPRFFRLVEDGAVINRYGFNSEGHGVVANRLASRLRKFFSWNTKESMPNNSLLHNRLLGVNLGKNKSSAADCHDDYIDGIKRLGDMADYIVINISSPNTPGLRALQRREPIQDLLSKAKQARNELVNQPPLLVKISPDCSESELEDIAAVVQDVGIDGVIISNTTVSRPSTLKGGTILVKEIKTLLIKWVDFQVNQ